MAKAKLTENFFQLVEAPEKGQIRYTDSEVKYLAAMITHRGTATWYYVRSLGGKTMHVKLGRVEDIRRRTAIRMVEKLSHQFAGGAPYEEIAKSSCPTLDEVVILYIRRRISHKQSPGSIQKARRRYEMYVPPAMRNARVDNIRRIDIAELHQQVGAGKPRTANILVAEIRAAINYGITMELPIKRNPAVKIEKFAEVERSRFLSVDEMIIFMSTLETFESMDFKDFVKIALFTGRRNVNVRSMRWAHIDSSLRQWTIPAPEAKARVEDIVVLDDLVMEILQRRFANRDDSEYVFPSSRAGDGYYSYPKTAWRLLIKKTGLIDVKIHDLRRTLGSWLANNNVSLHMIGGILGHQSTASTRIYARLDTSSKREAISATIADIAHAGGIALDKRREAQKDVALILESHPDIAPSLVKYLKKHLKKRKYEVKTP